MIFKKAFTDKFVIEHFVKDLLDLDVEIGTVETEKSIDPPVGYIKFELDIFAETKDKRTVIELQRVAYDYNFDRFMHYLMMLIAEQQKSSRKYGVEQTVYMVVVMTRPYGFDDKKGNAVRDEMIVTEFDSRNLKGDKIYLYEHQMVLLNPNHAKAGTPAKVRDWLELVYQSIHNPHRPNINLENEGIKRASNLIMFENMTPEERRDAKDAASGEVVRNLFKTQDKAERSIEIAQKGIAMGFGNATIAGLTDLSAHEIEVLREEG